MYSIGLAMTLRPGCYAMYKKHHDELWPEIATSMSDNEVSMAIFRSGERLFLHAAAPSEAHWQRSRDVPILKKWSQLMMQFLESDESGNILFEQLEPAFGFGLFKDG
jgi:L-rhamnose mutarotase